MLPSARAASASSRQVARRYSKAAPFLRVPLGHIVPTGDSRISAPVTDRRNFTRKWPVRADPPVDRSWAADCGWGAKVGDANAYRSTDAAGTPHFPGFGGDAREWLPRHRPIRSGPARVLATW
ncbi:hypothetical protein GCM10010172_80920 [Paractinoplanes ferrugineus]|uniref:Uncharacterized protein n=1 Tax=Paractinoplanes ferrugineus TaxID=113564 RepID=A0A919MC60_9ACTN|nr:hypothetical protein Afe05nite_22530 [Actinoplanes ferrugineus]